MPYVDPAARAEARRRYHAAHPEERKARRNVSRAARRAANVVRFVGIDGEGVDRPDGAHDYNLLTIGDRSTFHPDGSRLTFDDVAEAIWGYHQDDPDAVLVGFYLSYDIAMWLRDLPQSKAERLLTAEGRAARVRRDNHGNPLAFTFPITWKGWEFDVLPNLKRFQLRPAVQGRNPNPWVYINDTGGLFQQSLLKAIDPEAWPEPICTPDEYQRLVAGKAAREGKPVPYGTPVDPVTITYNALENDVLARMLTRYNAGLVEAMGVRLRRHQWSGPGQAAQVYLKGIGAPRGETCFEAARDQDATEAFEAARSSYFGGWFEISAHGPIPGDTWEYDINSAYPSIIASLPCLLHGRWRHGEGAPPDSPAPWRLVHAEVTGGDPYIGAMPHRTPRGSVLRPSHTAGWYWQHELDAARRAGLVDRVEWRSWWQYDPCDCPPPFGPIANLYVKRLAVGKSSPQGRAMKLVYNSAYGKMAQSVGDPVFGNPVYASLITAGCRTMILDAITTHPLGSIAVVMVATDGVYFTGPHPGIVDDPDTLGAWSITTKHNLSLFKPGMYWDDQARRNAKSRKALGIKSRGINERALSTVIERVDRLWDKQLHKLPSTERDDWPSIETRIPFSVVSPRQALNRNDWGLCGAIEHHRPVVLSAWPAAKRLPGWPTIDTHDQLIRTRPWPEPPLGGVDSTPYNRRFGLELEANIADQELVLPDGEANALLAEIFGLR